MAIMNLIHRRIFHNEIICSIPARSLFKMYEVISLQALMAIYEAASFLPDYAKTRH